jgi:uncharacterized protein YjbI with pentapeptide repeats
MADRLRDITFTDLLKLGGALAVVVPLVTAVLQYRESVQQDLDKNFRSVVEKLSSQNREERLSSASTIGTFIQRGLLFKDRYYDESIVLLINRLSIELDYSVLNAIKGSLEKTDKEEYGNILEKLLAIERNTFIQRPTMENLKSTRNRTFTDGIETYMGTEAKFQKTNSESDKVILNAIGEDVVGKLDRYSDTDKQLSELDTHDRVVADFISIFLTSTKGYPLKGLKLYLNSLNFVRLLDLDLSNSTFERSALSVSTIQNTKFNGSTITDTLFSYSVLTKSSFTNCTISSSLFDEADLYRVDFSGSKFNEDVFFTGSDLTATNFHGTEGLKPIYFYKAKNIDKAIFDPEFKKELNEKLVKCNRCCI